MNLTVEQKMQAIQALESSTYVNMREPGNWYVSSSLYIHDGSFASGVTGNGTNPYVAIEDAWIKLTEISFPDEAITTISGGRYYFWNGFMWKDATDVFLEFKRRNEKA